MRIHDLRRLLGRMLDHEPGGFDFLPSPVERQRPPAART